MHRNSHLVSWNVILCELDDFKVQQSADLSVIYNFNYNEVTA